MMSMHQDGSLAKLLEEKDVLVPAAIFWRYNDLMLLGPYSDAVQLIRRLTLVQLFHSMPHSIHKLADLHLQVKLNLESEAI